jgi:hypothetical protein
MASRLEPDCWGQFSNDPQNQEATRILEELDDIGIRNNAIARECHCHPSHLSQVKSGNHHATAELVCNLRELAMRRSPPTPGLAVLETCKGPNVPCDDGIRAELTASVQATLPIAWGGEGRLFDPPLGINGALVKVSQHGLGADLFVVVVRPGLGDAENRVIAHELEELAKVFRRRAAENKTRPPRPDY